MTTLSPALAPKIVGRPRSAPPPGTDAVTPTREVLLVRRCRLLFRLLAVLLCGLHAYVARHTLNPDGISYLDVADAYLRSEGSAALNAYWSPLYSWLFAGLFAVVRPAPYWESTVVHGVNFLIFLTALASFEWLLSEVVAFRRAAAEAARSRWREVLPDWLLVGIGYALFVFVSRRLVTVSFVTPDMCVAAIVYAVAALLLRMRRLGPTPTRAMLFGALLGLGYLAKAVLFLLGFVFLAVSVAGAGSLRRAVRHLAWSTFAFAALAAPFVVALSLTAGRPTFGDSGRLNYSWYVNGLPSPHRLGADGRLPVLHRHPTVTAFARSDGGTYPLWYEPARWYEGALPSFEPRAQLAATGRTVLFLHELFGERMLCFTLTLAVLFGFVFFSRREPWKEWLRERLRLLRVQYALLTPALAALGLYLLVGHAEGRLLGPFLVLLLLGLLDALQFRQPQLLHVRPLGAALLACLVVPLGINLAFDASNVVTAIRQGETAAAHPAAAVAADLERRGLRPGDTVGSLGFTYDAYWARLGRWQVVAEVTDGEAATFWSADAGIQAETLDAFRRAGARVVVADRLPRAASGWRRVAGTNYAVYDLRSLPEAPLTRMSASAHNSASRSGLP